MHKTKYALLHFSPTYYTCTNVYIGIRSTCMYKSHFHRTAFIRAHVAQSVEHSTTNLKDVGSSLTVSKNFSFCRFRRAPPGRSTGHVQMNSRMTFIRGNRCIEKIIIWKKNGSSTRKGSLTIIIWNITQIRQEGKKLWAWSRCEQIVRVIPIFPPTLCVYVWGGIK